MPCPWAPASWAKEMTIVSSSGVASGAPARPRTSRSNFAFWNSFSTPGSVSSGVSAAIAWSGGICSSGAWSGPIWRKGT